MNIQALQNALSDAGQIGLSMSSLGGVRTDDEISPSFKAAADKALSLNVQEQVIEELEVNKLLEEMKLKSSVEEEQSDEMEDGYSEERGTTSKELAKSDKFKAKQEAKSEKAVEQLAENIQKARESQELEQQYMQEQLEKELEVRRALAMHKQEEIKKKTGIDVSLADLGDLKAPAQVIAMDTQEQGMSRNA